VARRRAGRGRGAEEPGGPAPVPPTSRQWPRLSSRHRATLAAVFERPTRGDVPWRDVEALFAALGSTVTQGRGSRRRVRLWERRAVFHEPHPERVTDKGALESVRDFLASAGVQP
jgi:hypothetical protein